MDKQIGMHGGKLQGRTDTDLNENGIEQVKQISKVLQSEKIDMIISSPLKRTKQTAKIINEKINVPILIEKGIIERNYGELEGKCKQDINFEELWDDQKNQQYDNLESMKDFSNRISTCMDNIKEKYKHKNILLVTHGAVGLTLDNYFNEKKENIENKSCLKNGQFIKYQIDD